MVSSAEVSAISVLIVMFHCPVDAPRSTHTGIKINFPAAKAFRCESRTTPWSPAAEPVISMLLTSRVKWLSFELIANSHRHFLGLKIGRRMVCNRIFAVILTVLQHCLLSSMHTCSALQGGSPFTHLPLMHFSTPLQNKPSLH